VELEEQDGRPPFSSGEQSDAVELLCLHARRLRGFPSSTPSSLTAPTGSIMLCKCIGE
jgi:hypothetical protein